MTKIKLALCTILIAFVITFLSWQISGRAVLCPNYVACWKFNEGISNKVWDFSSNGNHGTISGNTTWTKDSREGLALEFDGIDDKIQITKTSSVDVKDKVILEAYIKRKSTADGMIISKNGPYFLAVRNNVVAGGVYANDGNCPTSCTTPGANTWTEIHGTTLLELNKWYLLKMTYDGSQVKVYVNSVLENSAPKTGQMPQVSQNVHIGWGEPGQNQYFKGIIDEVKISGI